MFFGLEHTGRDAAVITAFWGILFTSAYMFYGEDPVAWLFLLWTCLWVTVAAALNLSIYLLKRTRAARESGSTCGQAGIRELGGSTISKDAAAAC